MEALSGIMLGLPCENGYHNTTSSVLFFAFHDVVTLLQVRSTHSQVDMIGTSALPPGTQVPWQPRGSSRKQDFLSDAFPPPTPPSNLLLHWFPSEAKHEARNYIRSMHAQQGAGRGKTGKLSCTLQGRCKETTTAVSLAVHLSYTRTFVLKCFSWS